MDDLPRDPATMRLAPELERRLQDPVYARTVRLMQWEPNTVIYCDDICEYVCQFYLIDMDDLLFRPDLKRTSKARDHAAYLMDKARISHGIIAAVLNVKLRDVETMVSRQAVKERITEMRNKTAWQHEISQNLTVGRK